MTAVKELGKVLRLLERFRGNTIRGNRTESLGERNLPLGGSGFQRFLGVFSSFPRFFRGPLRDPLKGRFSSQRLSAQAPRIAMGTAIYRSLHTPEPEIPKKSQKGLPGLPARSVKEVSKSPRTLILTPF